MSRLLYIAAALLVSSARADNITDSADSCALDSGPWSCALEDWVTAERVTVGRHGRIMALPPSQGYYVSDRIDLTPPPPPPHYHHGGPHGGHGPHHMQHRGPYPAHAGPHHGPPSDHVGPHHGPPPDKTGPHYNSDQTASHYTGQTGPNYNSPDQTRPHYSSSDQTGPQYNPPGQTGPHYSPPDPTGPHYGPTSERTSPESPNSRLQSQPPQGPPPSGPQAQGPTSMPYDEWQATPPPPPGVGKIVNRPPNPYKDQFKPSYPPPSPQHQIPVHSGLSDRVDEVRPPPQKQVSETDLYLLGAIEKLVYRVDLMEKRLRKMEENVHYLVVGAEAKPEPCMSNFTRIGGGCYHVSTEALNWKSANYACRKLKGHLLELGADERRPFTSGLLADKNFKGYDYWTGGLNPGLLWIWSHSAAAVSNTTDSTIVGEGRCLALVHDGATNSYVYRGQDCGLRHRYVCEKTEDKGKLGNEIERVARQLRQKRIPKMKWVDDIV